MEIHKPKPVHSLREFLKEVGIIVIGVMIALGGEQLVETWHWRHKLALAEESMFLEQRDDDLPQAYVRVAIGGCLRDRLREIRRALDQPRVDRRKIGAMLNAYQPPSRTWDSQAWIATTDSDVAAHMDVRRRTEWALVYNVMPRIQSVNWEEDAVRSDIEGLRRLSGDLSEREAIDLSRAVGKLQALNSYMTEDSGVLLATAAGIGVEVPAAVRRQLDAEMRTKFGPCVVRPRPHVTSLTASQLDARLPDGEFRLR